MNRNEMIEYIRSVIYNAQNPLIFFDTDTDGTTSYFQLKTLNSKLRGFPFKKTKDEQIEEIQKVGKNNDVVIFIDIPYIYEEVFQYCRNTTIVWIDHHINEQDKVIEENSIIYFNSLNFDSQDSRPASYWAYIIADKKENLPLVSLGTLADFYLLDCINDLFIHYPHYFSTLFNISTIMQDELLKCINNESYDNNEHSNWIRYLSYNSNIGLLKSFIDFLYKLDSSNIHSLLSTLSKLSLYEILAEINSGKNYPYNEFNDFRTNVDAHVKSLISSNGSDTIVFYEYRGDVSYTRQIAEKAMYELDTAEVLFIAFKKNNSDIVSCSFRSRQIPIEPIVKETISNFNGRGGGHDLACGAIVAKEDFENFRITIVEQLKEKIIYL